MRSLRRTLKSLRPAIILASVFCGSVWGQSALTTIQDTLFDADGARFNGTLTIQWSTFDATNLGTVIQQSQTVQVVNGNLLVQLAPNNTATPPANIYTVLYQSDGDQQYSETWTVPASTTPLKVSQVRIGIGSSGGGGGSAAGLTAGSGTVTESSVTNLTSDLNARPIKGPGYGTNAVAVVDQNGQLETAVGNLGDCVFVDGTAGPCSSSSGVLPSFVDGETPGGLINGLNATFTLANTPSGSSLLLFLNGLLLQAGLDYTLSGSTIQFLTGAIPQTQDTLVAAYRVLGTGGAGSLSTGPSGAPGVNGCGAVGAASKTAAYQILASDNGYLLIQTANAPFSLPATVPAAGWCVALLDTYATGIAIGNNGNTINGAVQSSTLVPANTVTVVSDGSGYWITGGTASATTAIDRIFPSFATGGTASTALSLPSTNGCTPNSIAGVHVETAVCTFASGSQQYGFGHLPIPRVAPTVLYMDIKWRTTDTNTSHSATFNWYYGSTSTTLDPVLVSAGSVIAAPVSTSNQIQTSTITLTNPVVNPGDEFYFYLSRRGDIDSVAAGIDVVEVRVHN